MANCERVCERVRGALERDGRWTPATGQDAREETTIRKALADTIFAILEQLLPRYSRIDGPRPHGRYPQNKRCQVTMSRITPRVRAPPARANANAEPFGARACGCGHSSWWAVLCVGKCFLSKRKPSHIYILSDSYAALEVNAAGKRRGETL